MLSSILRRSTTPPANNFGQSQKGRYKPSPPVLLVLVVCLVACLHRNNQSASSHPASPPVEVSAKADPTTATTDQTITFTVTALYRTDIMVQMPEIGSRIAGLRIVDFGEQGPRTVDTRREYKKWFALRGDIAGTYIIPPMSVYWSTPDNATLREIKTPQIFIQITASPAQDNRSDICDIKPQETVARDIRPWIIAGAGVLLCIGAAAASILMIRRRRQIMRERKKAAHEIAFEEIAKLSQENLIGKGKIQEYYFKLSDIFRHYIENRFSIPAVEQTTQELLPEVMRIQGLSPKIKTLIRDVLLQADMVKFARHIPEKNEIEAHHDKVIAIITHTKLEDQIAQSPSDNSAPHAGHSPPGRLFQANKAGGA